MMIPTRFFTNPIPKHPIRDKMRHPNAHYTYIIDILHVTITIKVKVSKSRGVVVKHTGLWSL